MYFPSVDDILNTQLRESVQRVRDQPRGRGDWNGNGNGNGNGNNMGMATPTPVHAPTLTSTAINRMELGREELLREFVNFTADMNRNMLHYLVNAQNITQLYQTELARLTRQQHENEMQDVATNIRATRRSPLRPGQLRNTEPAREITEADTRPRQRWYSTLPDRTAINREGRQNGVNSPSVPTMNNEQRLGSSMIARTMPVPAPAPAPVPVATPAPAPPVTMPADTPTGQAPRPAQVTNEQMVDAFANEFERMFATLFRAPQATQAPTNTFPITTIPTRQPLRDNDLAVIDILRWDIPLNLNGVWNNLIPPAPPARPPLPTFQDISAALMPVELVDFADPDNPTDEHLDPIDLRAFTPEDSIVQLRGCGHRFRRETIMNAFRYDSRCPVCRRDIRDLVRMGQTTATLGSGQLPTAGSVTTAQPAVQSTRTSRPPTPIPNRTPVLDDTIPGSTDVVTPGSADAVDGAGAGAGAGANGSDGIIGNMMVYAEMANDTETDNSTESDDDSGDGMFVDSK
jgi:hypothetical protein